ncbi:MAG TPA: cytochrome c biogenesis protein DipZ, partial [Alphaproteobacteria bacterium]|nr:cytochrome c biogenesis protein DipZ [Alphaproteobacteria bacterium]
SFKNRYWPAHYLIDRDGRIVYTHFGEGNYDVTENNIRYLLGIRDTVPGAEIRPAGNAAAGQTAETYLGTARVKTFLPTGGLEKDTEKIYAFADTLPLHHWSLQGDWIAEKAGITALSSGAALRLHFKAGRVFLVMGTLDGNPVDVRLSLNGQPIPARKAGKAVRNGILTVTEETIYELVAQPVVTEATLDIEADRAGLQAYAFTFGQ